MSRAKIRSLGFVADANETEDRFSKIQDLESRLIDLVSNTDAEPLEPRDNIAQATIQRLFTEQQSELNFAREASRQQSIQFNNLIQQKDTEIERLIQAKEDSSRRLDSQKEQAKKELADLAKFALDKEQEIEILRQQQSESQSEIRRAKAEARTEIDMLKASLAERTADAVHANAEIENLKSALKLERRTEERARLKLNEQLYQLECVISAKEKEIKSAEMREKISLNETMQLRDRCASLEVTAENLQASLLMLRNANADEHEGIYHLQSQKIQALETNVLERNEAAEQLKTQVLTLQSDIKEMERTAAESQSNLARLEDRLALSLREGEEKEQRLLLVLAEKDVQIEQLQIQLASDEKSYSSQIVNLSQQIVDLEKSLTFTTEQKCGLEIKLSEASNQIANLEQALQEGSEKSRQTETSLRTEIELKGAVVRELNEALEARNHENDLQLRQIATMNQTIAAQEQAIEANFQTTQILETEVRQQTEFVEVQRQELNRKTALIGQLTETVQEQEDTFRSIQSKFNAERSAIFDEKFQLQNQLGEMQLDLSQLQLKLNESQTTLDQKAYELSQAHLKTEQFKTELDRQQRDHDQRVQELTQRLEQLRQQLQDMAAAKEQTDCELTFERDSRDQAEKQWQNLLHDHELQISTLARDCEAFKAKADFRDRQLDADRAQVKNFSRVLRAREQNLRSYAAGLNQHKTELKSCALKLASELKSSQALHPLNDYLAATEYQLKNLELQLKKTPTISSDRRKLEELLAQATEQRQFLQSILHTSQAKLENQLKNLESIVHDTRLIAVPPPPPKPSST